MEMLLVWGLVIVVVGGLALSRIRGVSLSPRARRRRVRRRGQPSDALFQP